MSHKELMEQPANKYPPNWVNYENEYASFQWDHVWDELSGASTLDKLNIACEAVDCHEDGIQEKKIALHWIGKEGSSKLHTQGI